MAIHETDDIVRGEEAMGRFLFMGPGLFVILGFVMLFRVPYSGLAFAAWTIAWGLMHWFIPGPQRAGRRQRLKNALAATTRVLGDIALIVTRIVRNYLREKGLLSKPAPEPTVTTTAFRAFMAEQARPAPMRPAPPSKIATLVRWFSAIRLPWRTLGIFAAFLAIAALLVRCLPFGAGASVERHRNAAEGAKAEAQMRQAETRQREDAVDRADDFNAYRDDVRGRVRDAETAIEEADDASLDALLDDHSRRVRELRDAADARHARAVSDFRAAESD